MNFKLIEERYNVMKSVLEDMFKDYTVVIYEEKWAVPEIWIEVYDQKGNLINSRHFYKSDVSGLKNLVKLAFQKEFYFLGQNSGKRKEEGFPEVVRTYPTTVYGELEEFVIGGEKAIDEYGNIWILENEYVTSGIPEVPAKCIQNYKLNKIPPFVRVKYVTMEKILDSTINIKIETIEDYNVE